MPELYIHMEGDNVLIIPSGLSVQLGASLQSVSVKMAGTTKAELNDVLEKYVKRLKLILFAGMVDQDKQKGEVLLYSSRDSLASRLEGIFSCKLVCVRVEFFI